MSGQYEFLKDLPPHKFYEILNEDSGAESYYSECQIISSAYPSNDDVLKLCGKLMRNISKLYEWTNEHILHSERCIYLNYWIYYEAINNREFHEGSIYDSNVITYLFYPWNTFNSRVSKDNMCVQEIYRIKSDEFLMKKKLYDDLQNYKSIKDIVNNSKSDKNNDYFSYITENEYLYNKIQNECSCTDSSDFCIEFHKYNRDNNKKQFCSLECDSDMSSLFPSTKVNRVCPLPQPVLQPLPESLPQPRESETGAFTGSMDVRDDTSSPPTSSHTLTISLLTSIIGIFPLLYIFYKFTSIGPWLRRRISHKRIISDYAYDESNENLPCSPETMHITPKDALYNIPHHSLINF
ncbi:PIR protein [Plasmodium ovale]|uniref:PIR protein n=1 Tax=Plasmodium ovale TaxID=36330 RepID=A0A1C3KGS1_PLAOA|nr:PIR protein [Plasmodium ovale]